MAAQQRRLLASRSPSIRAVLSGDLENPRVAGEINADDPTARQLDLIASRRAACRHRRRLRSILRRRRLPTGGIAKDRVLTAQVGQMLLFFLTLLLSTMLLSQLIEEKSNKIIEVIAAAMPIDALFLGKLFAMLAASVLGLVVWVGARARLLIQLIEIGRRCDSAAAGCRLAGVPRSSASSISR